MENAAGQGRKGILKPGMGTFSEGFCAEFLEFSLNKMSWELANVLFMCQGERLELMSTKFPIPALEFCSWNVFCARCGKPSVDVTRNFPGVCGDAEPSQTWNPSLGVSWNGSCGSVCCEWDQAGICGGKIGIMTKKTGKEPTLGGFRGRGAKNPR